jgi:hypothetical protein
MPLKTSSVIGFWTCFLAAYLEQIYRKKNQKKNHCSRSRIRYFSLRDNGRKDSLFYYCGRNIRDNRREALKKNKEKVDKLVNRAVYHVSDILGNFNISSTSTKNVRGFPSFSTIPNFWSYCNWCFDSGQVLNFLPRQDQRLAALEISLVPVRNRNTQIPLSTHRHHHYQQQH